jgi:hypothetical protein
MDDRRQQIIGIGKRTTSWKTFRLERVKKFAFGVDRETAALVWQARSIG